VVAAALLAGCSTAAAVLLDLPQEPETSQTAPGIVSRSIPSDTVADRPAIERVTARDSVLALLPRDVADGVDWMEALRRGVIDPRWSVAGEPDGADQHAFGFDFLYKGPDPMFDARFPHSSHVQWVGCDGCHPAIVRYRGEPVTMALINNGEACGQCHGPVSFATSTCVRCHEGMPAFEPITNPLGKDVVLARHGVDENVEAAFPHARFPHWRHRIRYRCTACHPSLFAMRAGSDTLTMAAMRDGAACGACHDGEVAFDLVDCTRCHTAPTEAPANAQ
jgi:c(7)-type cytochrome triheme protein